MLDKKINGLAPPATMAAAPRSESERSEAVVNAGAEPIPRPNPEVVPFEHPYRFLIHDRDAIFSRQVDLTLKSCGLRVLKTPVRAPTTNAFCERLVGTIRRECLDFMIPINERHQRRTIREWTVHYNRGRPHSALGPGIPEPPQATAPASVHRHKLPAGFRVTAKAVLGGLHHEYGLQKEAA